MEKINKMVFLLLMLFMGSTCLQSANYDVRVIINDGIADMRVKEKMESTTSRLLSELNQAYVENRTPRLDGLGMSNQAKDDVLRLWDNVHLACVDQEIVERCITTNRGYQVRNLPFYMIPVGEDESKQEYQEVVVSFSKTGLMESFFLTLSMNMYSKVMKKRTEVKDVRRRMEIQDYVEHFRTSYNQKDLQFLRQVFSDDALIITGRVILVEPSEVFPSGNRIVYRQHNKQQYLLHLSQVFKRNRYIRVNFDDIKIVEHPTKANVYGVTVHQTWNSGSYSDEGHVFMIWDFNNEYSPKIHVRTWQPDFIDKSKGQRLAEDDVFTLGDFDLGNFID